MLTTIKYVFRNTVNPVFEPDEDYAIIRKVKFLNFTCLISSLAGSIAIIAQVFQDRYATTLLNLLWIVVLLGIIRFNHQGKVLVTRYVFTALWIVYAITSAYHFGNTEYQEYYFIITLLMIFILYDSFLVIFLAFLGLFFLFLTPVDLFEFIHQFARHGAFFVITGFVKSLILEVEKMLKTKHEETLKYELQRIENQQKMMQAELAHKNQEITNFAFQITEKNTFIELLKDRLKEVKKMMENPQYLRKLEDIIHANESITKDRQQFEIHVQYLHEGFFSRLSERYPDISPSERRLAALLRLELSSKEISTILNISPKSVDMSRYRLRKKMDLGGKSSLAEALQSI